MDQGKLTELVTRYAAAWSGRDPEELASFFAVDGSLTVNDTGPSVGRAAIAAAAREYMDAFPDMLVTMDRLDRLDRADRDGERVLFHWTWTGTNTGPGGTGAAVHLSGYEELTIRPDGLIAGARGHYDEAEYRRQVQGTHRAR